VRTSGRTPALKNTYNYVLVPQATLIDQYVPVTLTQVALINTYIFVILGLRRGINEIALFWHFTQRTVVISYRSFRDNLVPSKVQQSKKKDTWIA